MPEELDAATRPAGSGSPAALVAWVVLIFLTAGYAVNHAVGVAVYAESDTDRLMLAVFAALNVYAVIVLLVPYRGRQPWAWMITWVSVLVFACCPLLVEPPIGLFYLGSAAVMALAQLATLPDFRRQSSGLGG